MKDKAQFNDTMQRMVGEIDDLLLAEGFDEALVGVASRGGVAVAVYDRAKCVEILAREMTEEEAEEYFDFNVAGAYVGIKTPVYVDI